LVLLAWLVVLIGIIHVGYLIVRLLLHVRNYEHLDYNIQIAARTCSIENTKNVSGIMPQSSRPSEPAHGEQSDGKKNNEGHEYPCVAQSALWRDFVRPGCFVSKRQRNRLGRRRKTGCFVICAQRRGCGIDCRNLVARAATVYVGSQLVDSRHATTSHPWNILPLTILRL
jgi:hypothetical protein